MSNYDPEPFVEDGEVVKACRSCGCSRPIFEFVVGLDDENLAHDCASCRSDDEPSELEQEVSSARYGERLSEGMRMLGIGNDE